MKLPNWLKKVDLARLVQAVRDFLASLKVKDL